MKMKKNLLLFGAAALSISGISGEAIGGEGFDRFVMPVSNPIYHGDARNITMVRPVYLYQDLPDKVDTIVGKVPIGGRVNGFAVQATYAINERFSIVAVKDGYVDCEPDNTLSNHDGFADLAAGLQYSFLYQPENDFIASARLVFETPWGDEDIYQGNGDGNFSPSVRFLKGYGDLQISGMVGFVIPIDTDEENTLLYDSWHVSYAVTPWFHPLVELNHFHVLNAGDRQVPAAGLGALGTSKEGDLVAGIARFNGCDIINLGGANSDDNSSLVTMALGSRFKVTKWLDLGVAYEFPLTDEKEGMIEDRFMMDAVISLLF